MYLQSLEIQGFKSFPDKIKMEFGSGITAIVGPNGSGKSNISDAVRWVLGEQSSKTLRGAKMEDVIFAGTQIRRAGNAASVTLNIMNNDPGGVLPSGEISVTRKLFRTGESEYLINGSQARLRDISELFMDTGLGRDGYAIIGQGRVAEIVSSKSNDRREIFEEAAGISKSRFRRDEATRQLDRAEEKLVRLRDIMGELEGRVEPLRLQSEAAMKFVSLENERKSLELSVWTSQLKTQKESIDRYSDEILVAKSAYETADAGIERIEKDDTEADNESRETELSTERIREAINARSESASKSTAQIAVAENDIAHAEEKIAAAEKAIADNKQSDEDVLLRINERETAAKQLTAERDSLREKINKKSAEADELLMKAAAAEDKSGKLASTLQAATSKLAETVYRLESAEKSQADFAAKKAESERQAEDLSAEIKTLKNESADYEKAEKTAAESVEANKNRVSGLMKLFEGRKNKVEAARAECDNAQRSTVEREQRLRLLRDLERNMEGYGGAVREIIKQSRSNALRGICGTVAELLTVPKDYQTAIEAALGGALQNIVVENEEAAKHAIVRLRDLKAGRATFLPVTSVKGNGLSENPSAMNGFIGIAADLCEYDKKYSGIFKSLLGRIAVAEDLDCATEIAKRFGYKFKIVTTDGQVINAGGSFTGGSAAKSTGILTRKSEIERIEKELEKFSAAFENAKKTLAKAEDDAEKIRFDIDGAKESLSISETDIIRFAGEQNRIRLMTDKAQTALAAANETLQSIIKESDSARKLTAEAETLRTSLETEIAELEEKIAAHGGHQNLISEKRAEIADEIAEIKLSAVALEKDIENALAEAENLKRSADERGDITLRLRDEIEAQKLFIADKKREIAEIGTLIKNAESENAAANAEIAKLHLKKSEILRRMNENRQKSRELSDKKEKITAELVRLEDKKNEVIGSYDKIVADMAEQYGIYPSEAAALAVPIEDIAPAVRNLQKLRSQIRALGNVNVAAIEEYKEVSERYGFLKEQTDDIEISKRELLRLISDLTDKMKEQFAASFEEINTHFKRIFIELFGGGKAELRLTDPDDILESGIEIFVAPPGKVIKNLSLLSGGEQAFVAIAIYFAILTVKPSPFCILDEIEAALDDVNVTKYARYLRRFTETTQFICVTHRRGTMDEADILYGITMQDKGISRILRLENGENIMNAQERLSQT
jgi:chromosome segregation protein